MNLYNPQTGFDPFGAYEIRQVFIQFLKDAAAAPSYSTLFAKFMMFFAFEELKMDGIDDFCEIFDSKVYMIDRNKIKKRDFDDIYEMHLKIKEKMEYEY